MNLIYEGIAKKLLTPDRVLKYKKWVEEAEKARRTGSLSQKKNQYDKAEELVTFYTFAPLAHEKIPSQVKNKVAQEILGFANMNENVREVKLYFEKDLPPPDNYLKWLSEKAKDHPIRYIREDATKTKRKLEGLTQVDTLIRTDILLVLIEIKFTSDISPYTRFGLIRNQIARLIDVGIDQALKDNKKLVILLCTPSELFQRRSRLYYYKIEEYSEPSYIQEDLPWRDADEVSKTLKKVTWVSLENVIKTVYDSSKNYLDPEELTEAESFFKERKLWILGQKT